MKKLELNQMEMIEGGGLFGCLGAAALGGASGALSGAEIGGALGGPLGAAAGAALGFYLAGVGSMLSSSACK